MESMQTSCWSTVFLNKYYTGGTYPKTFCFMHGAVTVETTACKLATQSITTHFRCGNARTVFILPSSDVWTAGTDLHSMHHEKNHTHTHHLFLTHYTLNEMTGCNRHLSIPRTSKDENNWHFFWIAEKNKRKYCPPSVPSSLFLS